MIKKIFAVLTIAAASTTTLAQTGDNSLTLSGRVQIGVLNPIDSTKTTTIDQPGPSRTFLALEAKEKLDQDTSVGFYVQSRFSPTNGNSAYGQNIFEQSKMYITTGYGTINAGKYTTNLGLAQATVTPFADDGVLSSRASTTFPRQAGQVSYVTPTIYGFQFESLKAYNDQQVSSTTSVVTPTTNGNDLTQNTLTYANGPVSAYYGQTDNYAATQQTNKQYGATYTIGPVKLMASQSKDYNGIVSSQSGGTNDVLTSYGAQTSFGKYEFGIATVSSKETDFRRTTASANYVLSSRTKIMAQLANSTGHATSTKNGTGSFIGLSYTF